MDRKGYEQYKQQSVSTMMQGELLILLLDELVKRVTLAELALGRADYPLFESAVDRCMDIIRYLDDTLDRKYPISAELGKLYEFFCYELSRIKIGRNDAELKKIKPMLTDLRDTFRTAQKTSGIEK